MMLNAPFGDCKTAELHLTPQTQSFGALIAIDKKTQRICGCSVNTYEFTGVSPDDLLNQPWSRLFRPEEVTSLFKPVDAPDQHLPHIQKGELNKQTLLIANHSVNNITFVEIEFFEKGQPQYAFAERAVYCKTLAGTAFPEDAARLLMRTLAEVTLYDRVMLYKFMPDWHGEVVAECLAPGVPGFIGMRFPASDIPATARRLYLISRQRVIADVSSEAVVVAALPDASIFDFTFAQLRAVHPVHIQYQ